MNGVFIDGQDLTVKSHSVLCELEKVPKGKAGIGKVEIRVTLTNETASALVRSMLANFPEINSEILTHLAVKG